MSQRGGGRHRYGRETQTETEAVSRVTQKGRGARLPQMRQREIDVRGNIDLGERLGYCTSDWR